MSNTKHAVLFLVEGITDKVSLEGVLAEMLEDDEVSFQLTNGDMTTRNGVTPQCILKEIAACIKQKLSSSHLQKNDISKVVHLIDLDGAFLPPDAILFQNVSHVQYYPDHMETSHTDLLEKRNASKTAILHKLIHTKTICGNIPYAIYFFSRNLEHVLHNIPKNLTAHEKMDLAEQFADHYEDAPQDFYEFLRDSPITAPTDYLGSWEFIEESAHSLQRFSNFSLFFSQDLAHVPADFLS